MTSRHTLSDAAAKRITTAITTSMAELQFTYRGYRQILRAEGYSPLITINLLRWWHNRENSLLLFAVAEVMASEVRDTTEIISALTTANNLLDDYNN